MSEDFSTAYTMFPHALYITYKTTDNGEKIAIPYDQGGIIMTHDEWQTFRNSLDNFFRLVSQEEITKHNQEKLYNMFDPERRKPSTKGREEKQEKGGYIYILKSEAGYYKIGKAKDPFSRSQTIGTQHAHKIDLIYIALCHDYTRVERYLHQALASYRMNGEWFNLPSDKLEWLLYHEWIDDAGLGGIVTSMERIPQ